MDTEWVVEDGYEGPDRRSGQERRRAQKAAAAAAAAESGTASRPRTASRARAELAASHDHKSDHLTALLALLAGEPLDPVLERELLMEGLVTRGSLAEGFQLTLRGTQLVEPARGRERRPGAEGGNRES